MAKDHGHAAGDHVHPGPERGELVRLGAVLGVITLLEFLIIYLQGMRGLVVTVLYALSAVKFFYVTSVFMHLKFDNKLLAWIFGIGFFMAAAIVISLYYILFA